MKKRLRIDFLNRRNGLSEKEVEQKSCRIRKNLSNLKEFKKARRILFYVGVKKEVQTIGLINEALASGKTVFVPVTNHINNSMLMARINSTGELKQKRLGLLEPEAENAVPISSRSVDLVVVPGIAFDFNGHRIGYGKGFFDKALAGLSKRVSLVGLAFEKQLVQEIPAEEHDRQVQKIVTEKRVINCSASA